MRLFEKDDILDEFISQILSTLDSSALQIAEGTRHLWIRPHKDPNVESLIEKIRSTVEDLDKEVKYITWIDRKYDYLIKNPKNIVKFFSAVAQLLEIVKRNTDKHDLNDALKILARQIKEDVLFSKSTVREILKMSWKSIFMKLTGDLKSDNEYFGLLSHYKLNKEVPISLALISFGELIDYGLIDIKLSEYWDEFSAIIKEALTKYLAVCIYLWSGLPKEQKELIGDIKDCLMGVGLDLPIRVEVEKEKASYYGYRIVHKNLHAFEKFIYILIALNIMRHVDVRVQKLAINFIRCLLGGMYAYRFPLRNALTLILELAKALDILSKYSKSENMHNELEQVLTRAFLFGDVEFIIKLGHLAEYNKSLRKTLQDIKLCFKL